MFLLGFFLFTAGLAAHHRAVDLLLNRWRLLRPDEWTRTIRPSRRAWPFSAFVRWSIVHQRLGIWTHSTPEWIAGDLPARRLLWFIRIAPLVVLIGGALMIAEFA